MKCCTTYIFVFVIVCSCLVNIVHSQKHTNSASDTYSYVLACGASAEATDGEGRKWSPDTKFLVSSNNSLPASAQSQDPSLPSTIPYMTARVFQSEATYKFPVSAKSRHWIRLHFYPSSYQNFDPSSSFFSISVGGFTLLSNFSAYITCQALTQAYIVREYTMAPLQSGLLDLIFRPSSENNGSFAFINGIEVISMPEIFEPVGLVGLADQNIDVEYYTLETMFRINVGGQYIPASNDSGLSRTWYDDSPYIFGAALGVTSDAENVCIVYPSTIPEVIAPVDVYNTARSMGPNMTVNENYNLTWVFQVDVNFTYLVRFHFCEYQFDKVNQRVFSIFVNNQTVSPDADVIAWAGGKGVPFYKDYAVYVNGNTGDDQLWVALHPDVEVKPEYYDAILNGLEIFKLNDTKGNLAGPNPVPSPQKLEADSQQKTPFTRSNSSNHRLVIMGSVMGVAASFGLFVSAFVFVKHRKKRTDRDNTDNSRSWLPIYGSSHSSGTGTRTRTTTTKSKGSGSSSRISTLGGGLCRHFGLAEIQAGTNDFDESRVIGIGGFGKVYKGYLDGGATTVAIKRANPSSEQGMHEFLTEIELLSKLRHRHLVSLIGACEENNEMILVYDYMANGTLREHLYKHDRPPLSWRQRLDICIGAARGLHYLHTGARYTIIHRDVKTTNILLDDKWVAKVSDFGLSKTGPSLHQTHVSTMVKGSFGYLDPEYFRRQQLTEKSDVYSFGVVLFEVLCGRPALNPSLPKEEVSLADWALINHRRGTIGDMIDLFIRKEITNDCLYHFAQTAINCLSDHGADRPSMGAVLWSLEYAMQLQNNPDGPLVVAEQKANDAYAMHATLLSIQEEGNEFEGTENHSANAVFSQIMNPQGR